MLPKKLAFVDLETTGARSFYDRIIEIGIVRVENNKIVKTYNSLLNPQTHLPHEIEILTGIHSNDLVSAPTFADVKDEVLEMLDDCVFVAHNVRFDYSFLKSEFLRYGEAFRMKHFCTVKLSRALFPQYPRHNLDAIIERFQFACKNRHRAFDDAKILFDFYSLIQKKLPLDIVEHAVNFVLKKPSLPPKLTQETIDTLPDLPGVYIFYGENDVPLYVGKSKNIRERVLSHFSADIRSTTEMNISQQIERIETKITAGELGALFTESSLIKQMLPIYNKRLRLKKELVVLKKFITDDGYNSITMETLTVINPKDLDSFVGFYRSRKQAKEYLASLCKEYSLCEKLLGLEKTKTACFGYRLALCKGACIKDEQPLFYNLRFTTAFFKTKLLPWPFPGPITIKEENPFTNVTDYFLVDKWCYIGKVTMDPEGNKIKKLEEQQLFDLDVYKILRRFMRNPANHRLFSSINMDEFQTVLSD